MSITSKASFKNSRVQPRAATTSADVFQSVVATSAPNTLIIGPNANRTYVTLRNENSTTGDDIRYDYIDNANILTQGFLLKASEAIDLETKGSIWARAVANSVALSIDEGQG
jgi:hypothetical protein